MSDYQSDRQPKPSAEAIRRTDNRSHPPKQSVGPIARSDGFKVTNPKFKDHENTQTSLRSFY